jgi:hypothetical protein
VARPNLVEDIISQLKFMHDAGVTLTIHTAQALMLGHIEHFAPHQENRKALVGLAARPSQSQTRANKTRPDQQDDQSARGPLCLKPEVPHNVFSIIISHLNHQFFSNQNNKTKPEHQSLPVELLSVRLGDGSTFSCSDLFVQKFLKQHLNYIPRATTRAHQKILDNADELMHCFLFRLVHTCWKQKICHPDLWVNLNQTQTHVQATGTSTFSEAGAKQVSAIGKEEKRAWTALVMVSNAGTVLPLQIAMHGKDQKQSLPKKNVPMMRKANA